MAINPPKSFRNGKNLECFRKFSINAALMSTKIVKIDGENDRKNELGIGDPSLKLGQNSMHLIYLQKYFHTNAKPFK